mmetsp:Transcript_70993/g.140998  ORF Transcript_70993/g.140998 Transcript_70993/m.140998 type:complete len:325 (-) Transcript_70993:426-1400(-)
MASSSNKANTFSAAPNDSVADDHSSPTFNAFSMTRSKYNKKAVSVSPERRQSPASTAAPPTVSANSRAMAAAPFMVRPRMPYAQALRDWVVKTLAFLSSKRSICSHSAPRDRTVRMLLKVSSATPLRFATASSVPRATFRATQPYHRVAAASNAKAKSVIAVRYGETRRRQRKPQPVSSTDRRKKFNVSSRALKTAWQSADTRDVSAPLSTPSKKLMSLRTSARNRSCRILCTMRFCTRMNENPQKPWEMECTTAVAATCNPAPASRVAERCSTMAKSACVKSAGISNSAAELHRSIKTPTPSQRASFHGISRLTWPNNVVCRF